MPASAIPMLPQRPPYHPARRRFSLGGYRFLDYKTADETSPDPSLTVHAQDDAEAAVEAAVLRAEAACFARDLVNRETAILAEEDRSFVERLIFWGEPTEYGTLVDPVEERRRIKENQALGRTITAGTTPTIERKQRALLEGIFD